MMLVSFLRCAAATWMVLAISRMDATRTTSAIMIEKSLAPSMILSSVFSTSLAFVVVETPGLFR